ncbi:MAG TPA: hypothetical protein VJN39_12185 [Gemmatimonadales bacterium]|nr:hypothetical protein [Gemmatimonadales bacterium]
MENDADLKGRFGALRRDATVGAPSFQATLAGAEARRRPAIHPRRLRLAAAVGVSVVLVLMLARRGPPGGGVAIDLATVRWHAPTDFLLSLPGDELLRSMPRFGRLTIDRRIL